MKLGNFYFHTKLGIVQVILIAIVMLGSGCTTSSAGPSEPQNSGLVIRYLTTPPQIKPLRGTDIFCVATDKNDEILTYEWSASGGEIKPPQNTDNIKWFAPKDTGNYIITVTVTNAQGTKVTKSVTIKVTDEPEQHPTIYSMTCDNCRNKIEASKFKQYAIRCEAVDPNFDEMRYTWFANIGRIEGKGNKAIWSTGSQYGNALITVIVTDSQGNETEGYLAINVSCCH